ncbi:amino acid ABC transporter substrate-binding protein [Agrobacterium sp.]|uniref:amino acid ABC transporter substrate-binding protein n=1 Tax=Agrobacterium sp. TaxID=361 RepID=UPI0028A99AB9|nr:amino acid ABC transporter substrate-binding protein [Agrobacterium sp.]
MSRFKALLLAGLMMFSCGPVLAQQPVPTLEKMTKTGVIKIGYTTRNIPFSFLDQKGEPTGYTIELCRRVVDLLKQKLSRPDIKIEFVERTASNRVVLLNDGSIDLECVSSTNTEERRRSVWFSYSHFITATRFVSLKSSGINTIADLAGRTVVVTKGSTNIAQLNTINREKSLYLALVQGVSINDAFEMVTQGKASAFVMDGILLASLVANAQNPENYVLSAEALSEPQPYGLMLRKDDVGFRDAVNDALLTIYKSGEINDIYNKWFMTDIGPDGVNLNTPMTGDLKAVFDNPVNLGG